MQRIIISDTADIRQFIQSEVSSKSNEFVSKIYVLLEFAEKKKDKVVFLALKNEEEVFGAGLFSTDKRKILGFSYSTIYIYGYSFFDYNSLLLVTGFENKFFSFIRSYSIDQGIELVVLDNIKSNIEVVNCLKRVEYVYCFDSNLSENNFSFISSKKSVKRHRNRLVKNFNYEVKHLRGKEISVYLSELASLHKERWAFDNYESSFNNKKRLCFYNTDLENRLLTIIFIDEKILAIHYGMLDNDKLIWHTPVLNIKYLDLSPIEALLSETASYCQSTNIQKLDFGIGVEKYKDRFSNKKDYLYQYYFACSFFTTILLYSSYFIKRWLSIFSPSLNLISVLQRFRSICNTVDYYYLEKKHLSNNLENNNKVFKVISSFEDFVDFCRLNKRVVRRFQYNRLTKGDYYFCLMRNTNILSEGWATSQPLHVFEINKTINCKNSYILYDFHTNIKYRSKGYYKLLLRNIIDFLDKNLYIYSLKNNKASKKAILDVGFKKIRSL